MRRTVHLLVTTYESPYNPSAFVFFTKDEATAQAVESARDELLSVYEDEEELFDDLEKLLTPERVTHLRTLGLDALGALNEVEALDMAKSFTRFGYDITPAFIETPAFDFDDQDTAIVLAGLRLIQAQGVPNDLEDVATGGGEFEIMGDDAIDDLCERINAN